MLIQIVTMYYLSNDVIMYVYRELFKIGSTKDQKQSLKTQPVNLISIFLNLPRSRNVNFSCPDKEFQSYRHVKIRQILHVYPLCLLKAHHAACYRLIGNFQTPCLWTCTMNELTVMALLQYSILALTGKGLFLKSLRHPPNCWFIPSLYKYTK